MKDFKELIERRSSIECIDENSVERCQTCNGIGSFLVEELVDYHKNDYDVSREECSRCKGDGRVVVSTRTLKLRGPDKEMKTTPYVDFNGDPFQRESVTIRLKIDRRSPGLEAKYPKLKEISYEEYDKLLEHYELLFNVERSK